MKAQDVRDSLTLRWPDSEYLSIDEAPEDSTRQGRRIDRLVLALWKSRGLQLDAIEIKVTMADYRREMAEAQKADFWWTHTNRFWIAAPADLAKKIKDELPSTWGLLSCVPGKKARTIVKAPQHKAEPLDWGTMIGLIRAAADAGANALYRAEQRGRAEGRALAEQPGMDGDLGRLTREFDALTTQVDAFEKASGIRIGDLWTDGREIGQIVATLQHERRHPGSILGRASNSISNLRAGVTRLAAGLDAAEDFAARLAELCAEPPEEKKT